MSRKRHATTGLVVLALLLGSLWASGAAAPTAGNAGGQLASSASLPGIGPAALPDRIPALRPSAERPGPTGRLLPLLLGLPLAAVAAMFGRAARWLRSDLAAVRSLAWSGLREARAPPHLQSA